MGRSVNHISWLSGHLFVRQLLKRVVTHQHVPSLGHAHTVISDDCVIKEEPSRLTSLASHIVLQ